MIEVTIRRGNPQEVPSAVARWRSANTARRSGQQPPPEQEARVRGQVRKPGAFLLVGEAPGELASMALGVQSPFQDTLSASSRRKRRVLRVSKHLATPFCSTVRR